MNFVIKRGIRDGRPFVEFYDDKENIGGDLSSYSRSLTGTTESDPINGIFTGGMAGAANPVTEIEFGYGFQKRKFRFVVIDFTVNDVLTIEQKLKERIKLVREWVSSIDRVEELEISLE